MKPEEKARLKIDQLLTSAGWEIQDYRQMNLSASRGVALREFQQYVTPDDGRKFTELYNVQHLTSNKLDITEECHRSIHNLWRQVLDYFDSFLIGLTATPSKQTLGFFNNNLVTEYSHEKAVVDGVNVGYDVFRIKTEITERGGKVDMISTGTDIKPLECLIFMRDVRSSLYFEQMKGRGTRTISDDDLIGVTPDAKHKTHFIIVNAVGVCETDKTDSRPLERRKSVAFDKLLLQVAMGNRDADTITSLAGRIDRSEFRLQAVNC